MADNTVTLILDGNVPLGEFAKGVNAFSELVYALAACVAREPINWVLADLQFSSAVATARADGTVLDVGNVVAAYENVGTALQAHTPLRYGSKVGKAAARIVDIEVERVRFETAAREAIVATRRSAITPTQTEISAGKSLELVRGARPSFGAIRGRIQTLTNRGALRFTLFDLHQDRAVSCYFEEGKQNVVRDLWGKLAVVEGMVTRDPVSGRPLAIRGVKEISVLPEPNSRRDFEAAMGAAPSLSGMSAEEAIRKVRDA